MVDLQNDILFCKQIHTQRLLIKTKFCKLSVPSNRQGQIFYFPHPRRYCIAFDVVDRVWVLVLWCSNMAARGWLLSLVLVFCFLHVCYGKKKVTKEVCGGINFSISCEMSLLRNEFFSKCQRWR